MIVALIIVCAMIFFFSIFTIILYSVLNNKIRVDERIKGFVLEEKENQQRNTKKRKRVKEKRNKGVRTRKELAQIENELYNVGIHIPVQQFLMIWVGMTIAIPCVLVLAGVNKIICFAITMVIAFGPMIFIKLKKKKRTSQLEGQLVDAINVLTSALKAGHSFQSAMNNIAVDMEAPISEEFGRVFRETQRGMTLEESLNRMVDRTGSDDLDMLCTAIIIQRKVGGNLSEVLEKISETIQSRISLRMEIKTRTSSGRLSGYIVGALPFILLIMLSVVNPDYASGLFETDIGHIMLVVGIILEVIGFVAIKKIVTIKY